MLRNVSVARFLRITWNITYLYLDQDGSLGKLKLKPIFLILAANNNNTLHFNLTINEVTKIIQILCDFTDIVIINSYIIRQEKLIIFIY